MLALHSDIRRQGAVVHVTAQPRPARARIDSGLAAEKIGYALLDTALGRALVACTPSGVCLVALGDSDAELAAEARSRFPHATLQPSTELAEWTMQVRSLIDHDTPAAAETPPLDMRGTAFQQRVWDALRSIPAGETRTYSQLAASIGRPTAVRAVASACGSNPVAVLVPCHRVIASDGSLAGYRWGVARKRTLLKREGAI